MLFACNRMLLGFDRGQQFYQDLYGQLHILHAGIFIQTVEVFTAGTQVGAGQTHIGQTGTIGTAPDGDGDGFDIQSALAPLRLRPLTP